MRSYIEKTVGKPPLYWIGLTIFGKQSISDVWQGYEYAYALSSHYNDQEETFTKELIFFLLKKRLTKPRSRIVDKADWGKIGKIKKIKTKALDEQQKNLFTITSGNFQISKIQIAELKKKINELRQSMQHTENVLEDNSAQVE